MELEEPENGCNTLVELCMTPGVKTVVSFSLVNADDVSFTRIINHIRRKGILFFVEEGDEPRERPPDTWRSLEVIGDRFDGDGEAVACYSGVIYFKWRLTEKDHDVLSNDHWSLNSIYCHGNNGDNKFIVDLMTNNMVCTLAELCTTPGIKTVASFHPVNRDFESLTNITDQMRREGRLFFVEEGEERSPLPNDTWLSVEVIGKRLNGNGVPVAWYVGIIHFKQRLTKEDHDVLSDEDWSLNSIVCHGNNDGDTFIVEVMTNMVCEPSLDDLLRTKTSVEFRSVLVDLLDASRDLPEHRATYDWQLFENLVSGRSAKKRSILLRMRCGSSNHFFRVLDSSDRRFALDVFAYQKVGNRTRFFSGPVQFSTHNDRLTRAGPEIEFAANGGQLMPFDLLLLPGKAWDNAKVGDRWEFNAVMNSAKSPPFAAGNDRVDSGEEERLQEIRQIRQARQKRQKILTEPNGLVLFESYERRSASVEAVAQLSVNGLVSYRSMSDELIVSPRRYLSQHDVVSKLMTKAADIAGFCREDDIRELFAYGLEGKQNLRLLYNHIGQIAKKSGPRQVLALNASVWRVIYAMNNNTIGAMLFCLFLAPAEVKGMMAETIGANWQRRANLLKESLESRECVRYVNLFQKQMFDNLKLLAYTRPSLEIWPDVKPCFDLFICCLNICVDLFPYELH